MRRLVLTSLLQLVLSATCDCTWYNPGTGVTNNRIACRAALLPDELADRARVGAAEVSRHHRSGSDGEPVGSRYRRVAICEPTGHSTRRYAITRRHVEQLGAFTSHEARFGFREHRYYSGRSPAPRVRLGARLAAADHRASTPVPTARGRQRSHVHLRARYKSQG